MENVNKEKQPLLEKVIFYSTWLSLSLAAIILTILAIEFLRDGNIPLIKVLKDIVLDKNNYKIKNQILSPEAVISFIGLWISLAGVLLSVTTILVTYYFSKKVVKVTENANEFLLREEEERFITKYQDSMHAFEKINESLKYANLLIGMDYRYIKNQKKFENMRDKGFKEIAKYYNVDSETYWNSTHAHFYFSHEDFEKPVYIYSENFLGKNDFDYRLKYYKKIMNELFEKCIYEKTINVINSILSEDKRLFGKLIIDLDKFRSALNEIHTIHDKFELNKYLIIRDNYKILIEKKESSTLEEHDIRAYELITLVDLENQYPSVDELSSEHIIKIENTIINHFQELLRKLNALIQEMNQMDKYLREVQGKSLKISKFI